MNFKKLFLVLILFSGFYACECFRETAWDITSFDVLIVDKYDNPPSDGVIEGDSVKLTIIFKAEFVESINPLKGFLNSAYATSCSPLGGKGLIDEVVKLLVTSNSDFNNITKGESLNDILIVNRKKSIADWISNSKSWMFNSDSFGELMFLEKPKTSSIHIFNLKFTLKSGEVIEQNTEEIQWD